MKKARYRIIHNEYGMYEVERKSFLGFWGPIMEWDGCDPLGFDYGYSAREFNTVGDAEEYLSELKNQGIRTVVKEME